MTNVDQIKDKARGIISDQIDLRTTDLGNVVGEHAGNLQTMGSSLRSQGQDATASLVEMAADRLNRVSTYLTQTDGDRIIHDIETVARTQPLITAAAGLAVGMTAARLLKAAATNRYRTYGTYEGNNSTYATESAEIDYGIR